ncbi:MAG TPA: Gfo/Idh/MocA family oxidoreductase, partial [Planctomycetaceae bacterium]
MTTPSPGVSRRQFLGRSAYNAAGLAAGLVGLTAAAASPSETVRLGVIGVRRQGRKLAVELARQPDAEVVTLCDIDDAVLDRAIREVADSGPEPRRERDFRRLLDDPRIDAVVVATPDHSHAAIAVEALRAGKDVYLETPVCHTLGEASLLADAAQRSGRVVQCGLFDRSLPHVRSAIEYVRSGRLGSVPLAKAWAVHRRAIGGPVTGSVEAPAGVDYDAWLFPTPERPFDPLRFHRSWNAFWDYGSGELGAWGVALLDLAA